ncbi:myosin-9-like isoform X1 [Struthio camelus]|uniref:myosin-9-like isoform X1 n=2 Tax=Struthio camelus TaxID=8801 RepID=UPI003603D163
METSSVQDSTHQPETNHVLSAQKNPRKKKGLPENTNARKLQTSFPPIHFSLSPPTKATDKSCKDHVSILNVPREERGQKINLPQVDKPLEKVSGLIQAIAAVDKSKVTTAHTPFLSAHSNSLNVPFDAARENKLENKSKLELLISKIPSEGFTAEAPQGPDCPNCKRERRIRKEYDKCILQSKRDKEALQERIAELEAELKKHAERNKLLQGRENEFVCFSQDSSLIEREESRAQLEGTWNGEEAQTQRTNVKQSKLFLEIGELKSQLKRTKKGEKEKLFILENEKDACLKEIAELKACVKRIRAENSSLLEKTEELQKALEKGSSARSLASAVQGNAEMLTTLQHSPLDVGAGLPRCLTSQDDALGNSGTFRNRGVIGLSSAEQSLIRMKETYKLLKRERNLLLDVMLIVYTRRWFLEEAVPYIRRTLEKCRVNLEDRN